MTDPDPLSCSGQGRRRGLKALFDAFRKPPQDDPPAAGEPAAEINGELVSQARAFQGLRIVDVMKPRADIVAVERSCSFSELVARFVEAEHSRMPVYKETLDEPVGVVHVKDVFKLLARKIRRSKPADEVLHSRHQLIRKVLYVPPSMAAAELLTMMRVRRTHMALVIDEFGGTDGLVTLEDLLEKLVGDIADEHDEADDQGFTPIVEDDDGWVVDGRASLEELEAAVGEGARLAPEDLGEGIETVAGLVNALAGRVPQRRELIEHPEGFAIEVLVADPRRVKRVRIRRAPTVQAGD